MQFKSGSIVTHNVRSGLLLTQMFDINYLCWIWVKARILQSDKRRKDSLDLQNVNGDYNDYNGDYIVQNYDIKPKL